MRLATLATLAFAVLAPAAASADYGEYGHRASVHEFAVTGRVTHHEPTHNPPYPYLRPYERQLFPGAESVEDLPPAYGGPPVGILVELDGRSARRRLR